MTKKRTGYHSCVGRAGCLGENNQQSQLKQRKVRRLCNRAIGRLSVSGSESTRSGFGTDCPGGFLARQASDEQSHDVS